MPDLIAVGDVMVDILAPPLTTPVQHARVDVRAGGSAVNAACAAAALGRSAAVVGCVGDDALGQVLRDELSRESIEARLAVVPGARTGRVVVAGGAIVAERGANAVFSLEHVGDLDAPAVLVSGYQLFRADSGPGTEAALDADAAVAVDLGSARLVESYGVDRARSLVRRAAVVFGNEDAVRTVGDSPGPLVVTTLGVGGARSDGVTVRPERILEPPLIGAGDAFAAGFLLALVAGATVSDCLAAGSTAVARVGVRLSAGRVR
jgi:sugar/nucleoside kinase (ribokinase family)